MEAGAAGVGFIATAKLDALEVPHVFVAVTVTFPAVEPMFTVILVVP